MVPSWLPRLTFFFCEPVFPWGVLQSMAFSSDPLLWWREAWPSGRWSIVQCLGTYPADRTTYSTSKSKSSSQTDRKWRRWCWEEQICGFLCYCQHGTNTMTDLWWKSFQPWTSKLRLCVSHESNDQDPLAMSRNVAIRLPPPQYPGHQNSLRMFVRVLLRTSTKGHNFCGSTRDATV